MNTLNEWIGMTWPILIAVGGAAWLVTSGFGDVRIEIESVRTEIGSVRTDLKSDIAAIDSRISSIEGKLDLVIDALNIRAEPAQ